MLAIILALAGFRVFNILPRHFQQERQNTLSSFSKSDPEVAVLLVPLDLASEIYQTCSLSSVCQNCYLLGFSAKHPSIFKAMLSLSPISESSTLHWHIVVNGGTCHEDNIGYAVRDYIENSSPPLCLFQQLLRCRWIKDSLGMGMNPYVWAIWSIPSSQHRHSIVIKR